MRHRVGKKRLGRDSSHRKAMLRNMVTSLFKYEQLETTDTRAKQLRMVAEKMITLAKQGDLHSRRQALAFIKDKAVTHRLFEELKDRYLDRQGGYVRIIKKGNRKGDGAPVSIIQLLPVEEGGKKGKKKAKKKGKAAGSKDITKQKKEKEKKDSDTLKADQKEDDQKSESGEG